MRDHRLSWDQRKSLHDLLVRRATLLRSEVARGLHGQDAGGLGFAEPHAVADDEPVADLQAALEVAAVQRDSAELGEVEAALQRLESPAFGTCVGCGAPIAWDRLLARPQVTRCARCQAAAEKGGPAPARM